MLAMLSTRCSRMTGPQHRRQAGSHKASIPTTPPVGASLLAMLSTRCSRMTGPTASPAAGSHKASIPTTPPVGASLLAMISTRCSRMIGATASPASRLPQSQHAHHGPCRSELARDDIDRMFQNDRGHSIAGKPAPTKPGCPPRPL